MNVIIQCPAVNRTDLELTVKTEKPLKTYYNDTDNTVVTMVLRNYSDLLSYH